MAVERWKGWILQNMVHAPKEVIVEYETGIAHLTVSPLGKCFRGISLLDPWGTAEHIHTNPEKMSALHLCRSEKGTNIYPRASLTLSL